MSKKYFRWKDPSCNGINPEWIEMRGREFFEFKKNAANKNRYFVKVGDGLDADFDVIYLEATKSEYDKWNAEHSKDFRRKQVNLKYHRILVSLDESCSDESDFTFHDIIGDENVNVYEDSVYAYLIDLLHTAIESLSDTDKQLIEEMYLNEETLTVREYANKIGQPKSNVQLNKQRVLRKLKEFF